MEGFRVYGWLTGSENLRKEAMHLQEAGCRPLAEKLSRRQVETVSLPTYSARHAKLLSKLQGRFHRARNLPFDARLTQKTISFDSLPTPEPQALYKLLLKNLDSERGNFKLFGLIY